MRHLQSVSRTILGVATAVALLATALTAPTDAKAQTVAGEATVAPNITLETLEVSIMGTAIETGNIVEVAVGAEGFETLVTAVRAAGLVETLSSEGPFTVFAPTDEAFGKLPEGALESLLEDEEALTRVLTYHVVSGKVTAEQARSLESAETVSGETLRIRSDDGTVTVNGATVVQADVEASNGVIHAIDTVLMPPSG